MKIYPVLFVCLFAFSCSGGAKNVETTETQPVKTTQQLEPLVDRDLYFGNPERTRVRLSPDGKWMSWLAPVKGVLNVFVAPSNDMNQAKPITSDTKRGIRSYRWAYDGTHMLYIQDKGGDENWHVYAVNIGTSETKDLTPFEKVAARIQAMSPTQPDSVLLSINDRDPKFHDVYQADLKTGKLTRLTDNTRFAGYDVDQDFNVRMAQEPQPNGDFKVFSKTGKKWVEFTTIPNDDNITTNFIGFKDKETAYIIDSRGRNTSVFGTVSMSAKDPKTEVVFDAKKSDVQGTIRHPKTGQIQAVMHNYLKSEWHIIDGTIEPHLKTLRQKAGEADFSIVSRTLDDKTWLVALSGDTTPLSYHRYDAASKELTFLLDVRPEMRDVPLSKMHAVEIPTSDGKTLVSYLTLPKNVDGMKPDQPLPTVVWVHGGPWGRDRWGYNPIHQWLSNRGYAVLSVNFRASTGFGKDFVNAGDKEWGGRVLQDIVEATQWAVDQGIADKNLVAVGGGSFGGYATLAALTMAPDVFAAGVDIVGPSNLETLIASIPPYWKPLQALFAKRVGDLSTEEGRALLKAHSPLTHVANIKKPLLIGQGKNDPRVKEAESQQIVDAMLAKNLPVTYVLYPDEGHGFARPENRLSFYAVTEKFLAQHLGGRAQPFPAAFENSSISAPSGVEHIDGLNALITP